MRRELITDHPCVLDPHDHVAWFGDGIDDLYSLAIATLGAGARRNEKLLFVAQEPDPSRLCGIEDVEHLLWTEQLELLEVDAVYGAGGAFSASAQLAAFEQVLADALATGYRGIRVLADNTPLAQGDDARFRRWLAWEQLTDRFQAGSMVTGICYFDRGALNDERKADLAAIHAVRSANGSESAFTLFADGDAIRVTGTLEARSRDQFARLLGINPVDGPLVVDLSAAEFDHHALDVLDEVASTERPVHVRARKPAGELTSLLGREAPHVGFEFVNGSPSVRERDALVRGRPTTACAHCGVAVGAYEPTIIVVNGNPRATSRAAEPNAVDAASELYHLDCYPTSESGCLARR